MSEKIKYYSSAAIKRKNATYNVIFGERSNGKTFDALKNGVLDYIKTGAEMAYVRRWQEDITGKRAAQVFSAINTTDIIEKATNGEFHGVHYWAGKWYLCNYDENGKAVYGDKDVFCYAFALSASEHDKSTSFPNIKTIVFDEFLTNRTYLVDEFVTFMNVISTIVRKREDVKIYMLGNTVNKFCPYFKEMGLNNILKMKQGDIDVYHYGESKLTVAVEYCKSPEQKNKSESHKYFAFDNPKLGMITGGAWEMAIYPHIPMKYKPRDIMVTYFIDFNDSVYQCEIINIGDNIFTYIHHKTTPIKNPDSDLIYSLDYVPRPNYNRNVFKPTSKLQTKIAWFFINDKVFYQDNSVGDAIANYLKICKRG
ncbi:UNVERIFIED_CONTAM: phage DNA encapsidation protein [Kocuria sp. CPCC 205274]|uniref:Phage DNA encapsidation protein n=1 Tax=Herbiconiux daphne TaxID=2970914 RepID=A0ABT2H8Y8_9MICO|nr:phage DNA encapsidation protein [Herbiconiux daphne]MCS5736420.1 phage DNA encapsidation protein [Herbiconiux daphne]